jgi:hypothetical protein
MEPDEDPEPTPSTGPTRTPDGATGPVLEYHSGGGGDEERGGWVHVYKAADPFEANLIVSKLQAHGIHARVDMENSAALGAWGGVGMGGTTVQALADDAAAVRAILSDIEKERARRRGGQAVQCPECGLTPAKRSLHPARKASVACLLLLLVVIVAGGALGLDSTVRTLISLCLIAATASLMFVTVIPRWRCPACQHQWAEPDPPVVDDDDDDEEADEDETVVGAGTNRRDDASGDRRTTTAENGDE